ncbi:mediator of RNA polymerase II transcription subunit 1-like isoform X2 [Corythoichthys intestinalis]|uniref:mediator of RNA polymerase II transcription subunit 1-like isoform X2 n=1 Tax=Corythoichthys intestinalis TaxID=161448 RepID=UPI0025A5AB75|nr:mediator of RNA polymerase II transcription subunit 1-like isoform X2 [Corythoichthys intestinalis]
MNQASEMMNSILSHLHSKYAAKTWNETFQLVRRCMDKPRDDGKPCQPLLRALERLQEVFTASSVNVTRSYLEVAAEQRGLGFHVTEATCYLTADLFYLEVTLLPCGGVEDIKVAPHGGDPVSCDSLLQPLRSKNFADFSTKLRDLVSQYDIPGDNDTKFKLFTALQHLWKDLRAMSHLPRVGKDGKQKMDSINDGLLGCLVAEKADYPLTIHFYLVPSGEENRAHGAHLADSQSARVTVGASHVTQKLQMASVFQLPLQLDLQGFPMLDPPNEEFPACFVLRLQPSIPVMKSFLDKIHHITEVVVTATDLQWGSFPKLLLKGSKSERGGFSALALPPQTFVFPEEAWKGPSHAGTLTDAVPFRQAAHVPRIVEVLRHQCAINALLKSCADQAADQQQLFEVRPESDTSFSVTFQPPNTDSLAVLLVSVPNSHQLTCQLYGVGTDDSSLEEHVSGIIERCMSIPLAVQALYRKLKPPADL